MNKKKVRILFIIIFPLLIIQMYYCYHNTEPFPAIMMPRFGYQQTVDNEITFTDLELLFIAKNGEEFIIDRHELLESMHLPQRFNAIKKVFSIDSKSEENPEFNQWLQSRIVSITQQSHGELFVNWHKINISKNNNQLERTREEIESKIIKI